MTHARVAIVLRLYLLEQCLNLVLQTSIKTRNIVTFYEFLFHLGMHHTQSCVMPSMLSVTSDDVRARLLRPTLTLVLLRSFALTGVVAWWALPCNGKSHGGWGGKASAPSSNGIVASMVRWWRRWHQCWRRRRRRRGGQTAMATAQPMVMGGPSRTATAKLAMGAPHAAPGG